MRLMGTPSFVTFLKLPNILVISSMWSGLNSLRLLPKLFLIFCQKPLASINCTLPFRASGFRLLTIQT